MKQNLALRQNLDLPFLIFWDPPTHFYNSRHFYFHVDLINIFHSILSYFFFLLLTGQFIQTVLTLNQTIFQPLKRKTKFIEKQQIYPCHKFIINLVVSLSFSLRFQETQVPHQLALYCRYLLLQYLCLFFQLHILRYLLIKIYLQAYSYLKSDPEHFLECFLGLSCHYLLTPAIK